MDALIEEEEQNGKQKKEDKERNREWKTSMIEEILNGMIIDPWEGNSQDQEHMVTNTTSNNMEGCEGQEEVVEERTPEILSPN